VIEFPLGMWNSRYRRRCSIERDSSSASGSFSIMGEGLRAKKKRIVYTNVFSFFDRAVLPCGMGRPLLKLQYLLENEKGK